MMRPPGGYAPRGPPGVRGRSALLDRHSDEAAPLGPRAVVVADAVVAEQVAQHEPGVRAALADAAVGDGLRAAREPLALVDRLQLVRALEAPVLGDGRRPGHVLRAGDVTAALGALLWKVLRRQQLARVLLRRADIDDLRSVAGDLLEHVVAQSADRRVRTLCAVFASLERRALGDEGPTLGDPLRATAVYEPRVLVTVVLQEPEEPRREPVVVVAVHDDGGVLRGPVPREELLELLLVEEIAHGLLLQVALPVHADRTRRVTLVV